MTEHDLANATARLASSEEKFLTCTRAWVEACNELRNYLKDNRNLFSNQIHAFDKTEDLMAKQIKAMDALEASLQAVIKGVAENNATLNETNVRINTVLTKIESYFGSGAGLEYDN